MLKQTLGKVIVTQRQPSADLIWQRGFFDHVLCSSESYSQKWEYVRDNHVDRPRPKG